MSNSAVRNRLVLVIDRLNAGFLGPYGNTWVPTPAINRLASESLLYEFALATSPALSDAYRGYWEGRHPLEPAPREPVASLPLQWQQAGYESILVSDDPQVLAFPGADYFAQHILVKTPAATRAAEEVNQTQFAELIAATIEQLQSAAQPFVLWMHAQGMNGAWDAPLALREHFRDEDDPEVAEFVAPPKLRLAKDYDPDELTIYSHAYAAQVMAIDECLEPLFEALRETGRAGDTLVALTAPRGYLLGQGRHIGQDALLADMVHVPLLVRYPDGRCAAERIAGLSELRDLGALLTATDLAPPQRDRVLINSSTERALRTPAWYLRQPPDDARPQLFAKPDDRYEVNDVAGRCREIVEQLGTALAETEQLLASGSQGELAPLAEKLVEDLNR